MSDESPRSRIYLTTPPLRESGAFAPLLEAVLARLPAACLLLDIDPATLGEAKKIARDLTPLAQTYGAAVLLRDPALVARAGADGAHLTTGAASFVESLDDALDALQPDRIVGVGGLTDRHTAMMVGERGVDYVMFGDVARNNRAGEETAEPTHDEICALVAWWADIFTPPCVAWAADPARADELLRAGADFVAFAPDLWSDPRGAAEAIRAAAPHAIEPAEAR